MKSNHQILNKTNQRLFQPIQFLLFQLQATSRSTSFAIFLSKLACGNTSVNSILAVSASFNDGNSSGIAELAKVTLAFAIVISISSSKVISADIATFGEAVDTTFSGVVVAGRSHDNEGKENNGLFQKIEID